MASITAGQEFRTTAPPGASTSTIERDAPALLALNREAPSLRIYTNSSPDYEGINKFNDRSSRELPLAIIRPTSENEVALIVRHITRHGLSIAIRNAGLDQVGRSVAAGSDQVSLDLRSLDSMELSADRQVVSVSGGVLCGKLLEFLDSQELVTPTAYSTAVGYVGWACGGGYGIQSGVMGLGVDNILGGRVVLANGQIMDTDDADADPDLLWALRGGGAGVVGVVLSLRVRTHRKTTCLAGRIAFPLPQAPHVIEGLNELYAWKRPREFSGDAVCADPGMDGGIFVMLFFWTMKEDESDWGEAEEYLERILKLGTVLMNSTAITTPSAFAKGFDNRSLYQNLAYRRTTVSVPGWSSDMARIISYPMPTASTAIIIHACHGAAVSSPATDSCAFVNRKPHLMMGFVASAQPDDTDGLKKAAEWADRAANEAEAAGQRMPYQYYNFAPPQKSDGLFYFGASGLSRMQSVKARLDPGYVFAKNTADLGSADIA